jgi:transposase-like protein
MQRTGSRSPTRRQDCTIVGYSSSHALPAKSSSASRAVEEALQSGTNISLVARRHGLSPSLLFRWRELAEEGSLSDVLADESVVPISQAQALEQQVQQLQCLLVKRTAECEILREVVQVGRAKKIATALAMIAGGCHRVAAVCRVLEIARSNVIGHRSRGLIWRDRRGRRSLEDPDVIGQLRDVAAQRATYSYRRLWGTYQILWDGPPHSWGLGSGGCYLR